MYQHKILEAICKEEDLILRDLVRDFVNDEIMPVRQQIDDDEDHAIVRGLLQGLANLGFTRATSPAKYVPTTRSVLKSAKYWSSERGASKRSARDS